MKRRYLLYLRGRAYYCEDTVTGKQTSLRAEAQAVASRLLHCKNEAEQQPAINRKLRVPAWSQVIRESPHETGSLSWMRRPSSRKA